VIAGGANWTEATVRDFAAFVHAWDLPVACAFRRQDVLDNRDPHYVGHLSLGVNPKLAERVETADLIVAFGTRLGDIATDGYTMLDVPRRSRSSCISMPTASNWARLPGRAADPCRVEPGAAMLASLQPPAQVPWKSWTAGARADHEALSRRRSRIQN
jgi:acetolactate synthase-1/2/3 large subunit